MSPGRLVLAAALIVLSSAVPDARGKEADASVELVSQAAWVGPDGDLSLRVAVRGDPDLELAVILYPRLTSRAAFAASIDQDRVRQPERVGVIATSLAGLTVDVDGATTISVPVARFGLFRAGVYPIRVVLRERGGDALVGFTTHLTFVPDPKSPPPLALGLVLPIHARPALSTDGSASHLPPDDLARIRAVTEALGRHRDLPATIAPTPETIDALASDDPAGLDALVEAVGDRPVVGSTFVPTSVPALLDAGLADETTAQLTIGAERLRAAWGSDPDTRTWIAGERLDDAAVVRLREQRIERVVVGSSSLAPAAKAVTGSGFGPFTLEARAARRLPALAADDTLAQRLEESPAPVLAAHRFLAELSVVATTSPTRRDVELGVAAVVPRNWAGAGIGTPALLDGLDAHPLVKAVTIDDLFDLPADTARNGAPAGRRLATEDPPTVSGAALRAARRQLTSFTTAVPDGTPQVDQLDRALLVAQSSDLRSARSRAPWIDGVNRSIDNVVATVRIPSRASITVTARRADVPITIQSAAPFPLRGVLELDSDSLDFPRGATRQVHLDRMNTSARFVVRARSSGTFPMRVRLLTPDGRLQLAESRLQVRSTAFSGVGVGITVGATLFLAFWWGRHLRRGRRARRLMPVER